jgi:beta-lactam-binding protein with PASTA domain
VTVIIGSGFSVVPEVRGAPVQDATTLMNRAGFEVTSVSADAPNLEAGTVIAQSSDVSTLLPYGSIITLTVAVGGPSPPG